MHIVQSPEWGDFKAKMGTPAVRAGKIQYTKHPIPLSNLFYAYAPRVNPFDIEWGELKKSLKENSCIAVNFDVPNVIALTDEAKKAEKLFKDKNCKLSPRSTFAKSNVIMDISKPEDDLLAEMHKKHRYNINYAERKGVTVRRSDGDEKNFGVFYSLLDETAQRQKYFIHGRNYYETLWEMLGPKGKKIAHILIAEHKGVPLTAWMVFTYDGVLYYPFGGSSEKQKNLQHSLAASWDAVKLGKELGCTTFDMWGAAEIPNNEDDPWFGFTQFKMRFGGKFIRYMDSYDFVINGPAYNLFNSANNLRWKLLNIIK